MVSTSDVRTFVADHAPAFFADLKDWLRIPSISGDPANAPDVRRSAEWLAEALRRTGFPTVEVWETENGGHPAVFAEWPADDRQAPTVVVYGHHDVQPVDPEELWDSPPFTPVERGDLLLGRAARTTRVRCSSTPSVCGRCSRPLEPPRRRSPSS